MPPELQATPRIIRHVTAALLKILEDALAGILAPSEIQAAPPETVPRLDASGQTLILYLYRVAESPELKNQGPDFEVIAGPGGGAPAVRVRRDPLTLNLHYLLIPFSGEGAFLETYEILGVAMKAFHDHGIFSPGQLGIAGLAPSEQALELRLTHEPLTMDQLCNVWEAVHEPYRLSVSYCVRTVQIRSELSIDGQRVTTRRLIAETKGAR
jgi:hypothetical protein